MSRGRQRSWQPATKVGEKQHYADRIEWRWYNRFLPPDMQLVGRSIPAEEWWTWKEHEIHIDRLENPDARVLVMVLHGGGGNGRILMTLGPMLRSMGAEVVAPDFPGYGLTVRRKGFVPSYSIWADLAADLAERESNSRGLPVVVFGLSIGGFLAYAAVTRTPAITGLVASTPADTRERSTFLHVARSRTLAAISMPLLSIAPPSSNGCESRSAGSLPWS